MIIAKIDVTKLDKARFVKGKKGIYADLVLMPNRDGVDQYGNDGMIVQGVGKEAREKGEKGAIVGNYRKINRGGSDPGTATKNQAAPKTQQPDDDDSLPF